MDQDKIKREIINLCRAHIIATAVGYKTSKSSSSTSVSADLAANEIVESLFRNYEILPKTPAR